MTYLLDVDTFNCLSNIGDKIVPLIQNSSIKILVLLNTLINTVLPIVNNTSVDTISYDTILPVLNSISIDTISSTLMSESNTVHFDKMDYLANNYVHILNMKNIAIDLLCSKANISSSSVMLDFNLYKSIPFLLERYYISSVSCSWGHS